MASKWLFPTQKSGLTDYHSIPTEKALDSKLETFIREVLQNSNDQGLDNDDPVEVHFRFEELTGDDLNEYLDALDWEEELKSHIVGATENEQARDPGLERFLNEFDEERLLVLTIEDRNTTGLEGNETDNSQPYGALVKDFGGSEKPDASSGGSHGVGKTVLWAFSGISTVLFCSNPRSVPDFGGDERTPPRLVGRSILPAHDHEDETLSYTNHGWFGFDDEEEVKRIGRPRSMWASDDGWSDVADPLGVDRDTDATGTNISVVGFRIPGEDINPDPEELADDFLTASVKHFWPAIERGELEVYVETPDGEERGAEWSDAPGVEPFVEAFRKRESDPGQSLEEPGDIAKTTVDITVPAENGDLVDDPDDETETDVDLFVRHLSPSDIVDLENSDDDDLEPKRVARMRGANMIVDYVDVSNVGGRTKDFVGTMVAGEGRTPEGETSSDEDEAVEKFLKRSEPTQHDDWIGSENDYLKKYYTGTIVKEVEGLSGSRLLGELEELVDEEVESGADIPSLSDRIRIMTGRNEDVETNGTRQTLDWEKTPSPTFEDGRWQFSGEVGPSADEHGDWELEIELVEYDEEDNKAGEVPVSSLTVMSGAPLKKQDDKWVIEADASMDTIEFEGESARRPDPDFEVGEITLTEVVVSGEVQSGGDE